MRTPPGPTITSAAALAFASLLLVASAVQGEPLFEELPAEIVNPQGLGLGGRAAALGDYDNDGWTDLFLNVGRGLRPIHNEGGRRLGDHSHMIGNPLGGEAGGGLAFGDYDKDGDLDLYRPAGLWVDFQENQLLRNDRGVFVDVTAESGLTDAVPTDNAVWLDFDRDGLLDLFTGNPGCDTAEPVRSTTNLLYRNNGDGTFTDVTASAGLGLPVGTSTDEASGRECGHGSNGSIAAADFDGDGWQDLYVGVFGARNRLFLNDREGGFRDATTAPVDDEGKAFYSAVGDIDNDGDLDLLQTNQQQEPVLLENLGEGRFADITAAAGVTGMSPIAGSLCDLDNDGDLDLLTSWNHHVLLNDGDGTFSRVTDPGTGNINGGLLADFDQDGFLDLHALGPGTGRLLLGIDNGNHWLRIELVGRQSDVSGIGALVTATAGDLRQVRQILGGNGYDQDERIPHFGLGAHDRVDALVIHWPSGQVDELTNISAGQKIRVVEGQQTYHVVRSSGWIDLPDSAAAGSVLTTYVRPALFDAQARVTHVAADLSSLGGAHDVPLQPVGNGLFQLVQYLPEASNGMREISVMVDQETTLGRRWMKLSRTVAVFPAGDLVVLAEGLADGWQVDVGKAESVDVAQSDVVRSGGAAAGVQTVENARGWQFGFEATEPVTETYGYVLRFAFHPGTVTPPKRPNIQLTPSPGRRANLSSQIDLAEKDWQLVEIPLEGGPLEALQFVGNFGGTFYLDDIRLEAIRPSPPEVTAVREVRTAVLPQAVALSQNYPNPFNAETTIRFDLPAASDIELVVFDLLGQQVATLAHGRRPAGSYAVRWDGRSDGEGMLATGAYFLRLRAGDQVEARKLLLLR